MRFFNKFLYTTEDKEIEKAWWTILQLKYDCSIWLPFLVGLAYS